MDKFGPYRSLMKFGSEKGKLDFNLFKTISQDNIKWISERLIFYDLLKEIKDNPGNSIQQSFSKTKNQIISRFIGSNSNSKNYSSLNTWYPNSGYSFRQFRDEVQNKQWIEMMMEAGFNINQVDPSLNEDYSDLIDSLSDYKADVYSFSNGYFKDKTLQDINDSYLVTQNNIPTTETTEHGVTTSLERNELCAKILEKLYVKDISSSDLNTTTVYEIFEFEPGVFENKGISFLRKRKELLDNYRGKIKDMYNLFKNAFDDIERLKTFIKTDDTDAINNNFHSDSKYNTTDNSLEMIWDIGDNGYPDKTVFANVAVTGYDSSVNKIDNSIRKQNKLLTKNKRFLKVIDYYKYETMKNDFNRYGDGINSFTHLAYWFNTILPEEYIKSIYDDGNIDNLMSSAITPVMWFNTEDGDINDTEIFDIMGMGGPLVPVNDARIGSITWKDVYPVHHDATVPNHIKYIPRNLKLKNISQTIEFKSLSNHFDVTANNGITFSCWAAIEPPAIIYSDSDTFLLEILENGSIHLRVKDFNVFDSVPTCNIKQPRHFVSSQYRGWNTNNYNHFAVSWRQQSSFYTYKSNIGNVHSSKIIGNIHDYSTFGISLEKVDIESDDSTTETVDISDLIHVYPDPDIRFYLDGKEIPLLTLNDKTFFNITDEKGAIIYPPTIEEIINPNFKDDDNNNFSYFFNNDYQGEVSSIFQEKLIDREIVDSLELCIVGENNRTSILELSVYSPVLENNSDIETLFSDNFPVKPESVRTKLSINKPPIYHYVFGSNDDDAPVKRYIEDFYKNGPSFINDSTDYVNYSDRFIKVDIPDSSLYKKLPHVENEPTQLVGKTTLSLNDVFYQDISTVELNPLTKFMSTISFTKQTDSSDVSNNGFVPKGEIEYSRKHFIPDNPTHITLENPFVLFDDDDNTNLLDTDKFDYVSVDKSIKLNDYTIKKYDTIIIRDSSGDSINLDDTLANTMSPNFEYFSTVTVDPSDSTVYRFDTYKLDKDEYIFDSHFIDKISESEETPIEIHSVKIDNSGEYISAIYKESNRNIINSIRTELRIYRNGVRQNIKYNSSSYNQVYKLFNSGYDELGSSVAMSADGQYIVCGAPDHDNNKGSLVVFKLNTNGLYKILQKLKNTTGANDDKLGSSVAINANGEYIVGGAPGHFDGGYLVVFKRDISGIYNKVDSFEDSNSTEYDKFGHSVAISSNGQYIVGTRIWNIDEEVHPTYPIQKRTLSVFELQIGSDGSYNQIDKFTDEYQETNDVNDVNMGLSVISRDGTYTVVGLSDL